MKTTLFDLEDKSPLSYIPFILSMGNLLTNYTLSSVEVQKLLKSKETFDVIVIEDFLAPAFMGFMDHYKAPVVIVSSTPASSSNSEQFGNPHPVSYIPHPSTKFSSHMSFFQRMFNALVDISETIFRHVYFYPAQNKILHQHFPNSPDLDELLYNASLILLNSHVSVNDPVPHTPNMIEIGGYHVSPPKELPTDLKKFLDGAEEGVIYFSMGSNLKSAEMPDEKKRAIFKAFSKIKQKVLWKFETESSEEMPANVKISKWLPQQDILGNLLQNEFIIPIMLCIHFFFSASKHSRFYFPRRITRHD